MARWAGAWGWSSDVGLPRFLIHARCGSNEAMMILEPPMTDRGSHCLAFLCTSPPIVSGSVAVAAII